MYLKHYQLSEIPFDISPNPKFLWMGEKYKEALATLEYGILESKGFVLLTGDVGTGKTTLLNMLLNDLGDEATTVKIPDPSFTNQEFYYYVAKSLRIKGRFNNKGVFLDAFEKILYSNHLKGRKTLLVVDEAQRITHELAEEIRMLSNMEKENVKLLTIILAGQNELGDFLWNDKNRALRQRITTQYTISPLSRNETRQYIETRLHIAGANHEIFDSRAIREIYAFSKGCPRLVNIICDRALLTGYSKDVFTIDKGIIKECAAELTIPKYSINRGNPEDTQKPRSKRLKPVLAGIAIIAALLAGLAAAGFLGFSFTQNSSSQNTTSSTDSKSITHKSPEPQHVKPSPSRTAGSGNGNTASESFEPKQETISNNSADRVAPIISPEKIVIQFGRNAERLPEKAVMEMERLIRIMGEHPEGRVEIKGYTDSKGDYNYNMQLSLTRANIVKKYLIENGLKASAIETEGLGPNNPVASNDTPQGRQANRRVEVEPIFNRSEPLTDSGTNTKP